MLFLCKERKNVGIPTKNAFLNKKNLFALQLFSQGTPNMRHHRGKSNLLSEKNSADFSKKDAKIGKKTKKSEPPAGLEPATLRLKAVCSIQLSYGSASLVILSSGFPYNPVG